MATVNYSWTLPTVGASVNTWGTLLNTIIDDIDAKMVSKTGTQTLTNKTLTAPVVTGGLTVSSGGASITGGASISGNVSVAGSVSATGITFPSTQNASSDANTLDDYEEGTWTTNATAVTNCSSISVSSAVYVKVGRQVTCEITGTFSVTAAGANTFFIFDVPFNAQLSAGGAPGQGTYGNSTNNNGLVIDNSGGTASQYGFWVQGVNNTESGAGKAFQLGFTYIAAA